MKTEIKTEKWLLHADGRVTNRPTPEQILAEARHWMEWSEETSSRLATVCKDDEREVYVVETIHLNNYDATEEARFEWLSDAQTFCTQLNQKRLSNMVKALPLLALPEDVTDVYVGRVKRGEYPQERKCDIVLSLSNGQMLEDDAHWTTNEVSDNNYNFNRVEKTIKDMLEVHGFEYSSEVAKMDL